mmetsp:Transcript_45393/g.86800  ORF Transcript_45393/g.86800 Transcript_45393/m.86800 type:complete len:213 (-) Transcript_45393:675-1313(-)
MQRAGGDWHLDLCVRGGGNVSLWGSGLPALSRLACNPRQLCHLRQRHAPAGSLRHRRGLVGNHARGEAVPRGRRMRPAPHSHCVLRVLHIRGAASPAQSSYRCGAEQVYHLYVQEAAADSQGAFAAIQRALESARPARVSLSAPEPFPGHPNRNGHAVGIQGRVVPSTAAASDPSFRGVAHPSVPLPPGPGVRQLQLAPRGELPRRPPCAGC